MSVKLTCPVCERSQIETNTCPNCETDLSTYRMLAELPVETPVEIEEQKRTIPIWLPIGIAVLFLSLGIGLGFAGNSIIAKQQQTLPTIDISTTPTQIDKPTTPIISEKTIEKETEPKSKSCGGFNYVVRSGDSLSLIASRFYGDFNSWSLISDANPIIKGRENAIEIGESLLVPNLETNCLNS